MKENTIFPQQASLLIQLGQPKNRACSVSQLNLPSSGIHSQTWQPAHPSVALPMSTARLIEGSMKNAKWSM
jgi:hypothetical protein